MRYYQDWRDYTNRPEIKQLIENKGVDFVRQQYTREINKMQWFYPNMINETNQPGMSVHNQAAQGMNDGGSTQFITGYSKETSTFTFANVNDDFTGSANPTSASIHGTGFDVWAYNGGTDFTRNYTDTVKQIRFLITTGSGTTFDSFGSAACVITASTTATTGDAETSLISLFKNAINNQTATAQVAGFTNTFAPSDIISGSSLGRVLTITREYNAGVPDISLFAGPTTVNLSDTASVATPVNGLDTYYFSPGSQVFDGATLPWATMPRK